MTNNNINFYAMKFLKNDEEGKKLLFSQTCYELMFTMNCINYYVLYCITIITSNHGIQNGWIFC